MRDPHLSLLWKNSVQIILNFLQTHKDELFKNEYEKGEASGISSSTNANSSIILHKGFIYKHEHELREGVDLSSIVDYLHSRYQFGSRKSGGSVVTTQKAYETTFKYYFLPFIDYYLRRVNSFDFDETVFYDIYEALEEHIYTGKEPSILFSPLFNFRSDIKEELFFENYLSIRPMKPLEIDYLRDSFKEQFSEKEFEKLKFAVCHVTDIGHEKEDKHKYGCEDVLKVLRLIKPEPVQAPFAITYPLRPSFGTVVMDPGVIQEVGVVHMPGKTYMLAATHIQQMINTWHQYKASRDLSKYEIAIDRFDDVYKRVYDKDKLIDCWVGLENIFLRGIKDELRFRASVRIAYFLGGSDADERNRIYKNAMNSYDIRSKLVHGGNVTEHNLHSAASNAFTLLRDSLKLLLNPEKVHLLDKIDSVIING